MSDFPNTLYYGDNLEILRRREYFPDESVDLIYLDPPFNSTRTYNVLFKDESGQESDSQITAFEDTWHWGQEAESTYHDLVHDAPDRVVMTMSTLRQMVGTNQMMAYLVMMAARLVELHRVLKPTGSLYLHCDPTASHYLKVILDSIFGMERFRNEITWKRTSSHNDARRNYGNLSDVIFFYTKSDTYTFHRQYRPYDPAYIDKFYRHIDEDGRQYQSDNLVSPNPRPNLTYEYKGYKPHKYGWKVSRQRMEQLDRENRLIFPESKDGRIRIKRYLDEMPGIPLGNIWDDIKSIPAQSKERLGYPTQKPVALLERIVSVSSSPGDIVLDPFCGCGTTIAAAQRLGRNWIGIDITHLSVTLQVYRLEDMFNLKKGRDFQVVGEPTSVDGARQLASENRYQFQWWALSLVRAKPVGGQAGDRKGKKGKDQGIDGVINFLEIGGSARRVLVQVKSGKVKSGDIRDLAGAVEREKAAIGVFITLEDPSRDMLQEAVTAGYYMPPSLGEIRKYPRIQILTIGELMEGSEVDMPPAHGTFKQAERAYTDDSPTTRSMFDE